MTIYRPVRWRPARQQVTSGSQIAEHRETSLPNVKAALSELHALLDIDPRNRTENE